MKAALAMQKIVKKFFQRKEADLNKFRGLNQWSEGKHQS